MCVRAQVFSTFSSLSHALVSHVSLPYARNTTHFSPAGSSYAPPSAAALPSEATRFPPSHQMHYSTTRFTRSPGNIKYLHPLLSPCQF
jgi:hypothetical protein